MTMPQPCDLMLSELPRSPMSSRASAWPTRTMIPAEMERLISVGWDRAALDRIASSQTALAIWWRQISPALHTAMEALDLDTIEDVSVEIDATESINGALRSAGYPAAALAALTADMDLLLRRHTALTGEDRVRLQLAVVDTDACSRFHAHYGTLRMLCTYVGSGTQWCCVDGQDAICEVPTGAVGVFKGRMLRNPPAILHRSPPSTGIGDQRLVLTIDAVPQF